MQANPLLVSLTAPLANVTSKPSSLQSFDQSLRFQVDAYPRAETEPSSSIKNSHGFPRHGLFGFYCSHRNLVFDETPGSTSFEQP